MQSTVHYDTLHLPIFLKHDLKYSHVVANMFNGHHFTVHI